MSMELFGVDVELILMFAGVVGWVVLMRFVLPKLGVST
jgi:hypothetical protein